MRFLMKSLGGLAILGLAMAFLLMAADTLRQSVQARSEREARAPTPQERVFSVRVVEARPQTITPVLEVFGEVLAERELELRSAAAGRVDWVSAAFVEGGNVKEGEEILRLDQADARASLNRAQADLIDAQSEQRNAAQAVGLAQEETTQAQAQIALRTRTLERQQDLAARGVGSDSAVEQAELALSSAQATLLSRRQALASAEARLSRAATAETRATLALQDAERALDDTVLTARFDGVLSDIAVREGALIGNGEPAARLIDPNALEVAVRLSTAQFARLLDSEGQLLPLPAVIELKSGDGAITTSGVLERQAARLGAEQTGREVFVRIDQAGGFKPGDFVTVELEEPELTNVVLLPATALGPDQSVLILTEDNRLQPIPVQLARRQGDDVLVYAEELIGEQVVAQRTPLLGEGIRVEVIGAPESTLQLSTAERAALRAIVEQRSDLPQRAKDGMLAALEQPDVPAELVARIRGQGG